MMTTRQLFALALLGLLTLKVNAHEDEPNLHLGSVKSFQVSASINAPSGAGLSLRLGGQKSPWLVSAPDLAELIDRRRTQLAKAQESSRENGAERPALPAA